MEELLFIFRIEESVIEDYLIEKLEEVIFFVEFE